MATENVQVVINKAAGTVNITLPLLDPQPYSSTGKTKLLAKALGWPEDLEFEGHKVGLTCSVYRKP